MYGHVCLIEVSEVLFQFIVFSTSAELGNPMAMLEHGHGIAELKLKLRLFCRLLYLY